MHSVETPDRSQLAWSKKLLLLSVSLVVSLLMVEIALRLLGLHFQSSFETLDPTLGWALRPGASGWSASEGGTDFTVNSGGNHDRERQQAKPPGTFRIAVLGDSFVEVEQLPLDETFLALMEKALPGCSAYRGRRVEVLNFGVRGYGQGQELLMLRSRVWKYQPDIVILSVYFGNDLFDNFRQLDYTTPELRPYFVYRGEKLVLDDSFVHNPRFDPAQIRRHNFVADLVNHSRLLLLLHTLKLALGKNPSTEEKKRIGVGSVPPNYVAVWPYLQPVHPYHQEAWRVTEGLIVEMALEVRAHNAGFLVATMPMARQVDPDLSARLAFQKELGIDSLYYADERLRFLTARNQIPFVALSEPIGVEAAREHRYLTGGEGTIRGEGHLNRIGHRVTAEALSRKICDDFAALRPTDKISPPATGSSSPRQ